VDGGTFWMGFDQFIQYFDIIHYCRIFDGMVSAVVYGRWSEVDNSVGGQEYFASWRNNPQFVLQLSQPGSIFIILEQGDPRFTDLEQVPMAFGLWRTTSISRKLLETKDSNLVHRTSYGRSEISVDLRNFAAGSYILVPSTVKPHQEQSFHIRVYSNVPVTLAPLRSGWMEYTAEGRWAEGMCSGQGHSKNPKFLLSTSQQGEVYFSLQLKQDSERQPLQLFIYDNGSSDSRMAVSVRSDGMFAGKPYTTTPAINHIEATLSVPLGKGNWVLVATTQSDIKNVDFVVKVFSEFSATLKPLS